ncbi:MAG: 30S ribosomal protein S4 [Candidatus Altiarchaeota archaeon]|nr:30S ribosomal protein S4 [Candidatus Altiarchaeota archaeon]
MGGKRKQRRTYARPQHPWKAEYIAEENEVVKKYGLKNKKELWKAKDKLRRIRRHARKLLGLTGDEALKERQDLVGKLATWGVLKSNTLDEILALKVDDLLERRLQTIVFKKALTKTIKQARLLVTHKHVTVGSRIISVPGYIVLKSEEDGVKLSGKIKVNDFDGRKEKEVQEEGK